MCHSCSTFQSSCCLHLQWIRRLLRNIGNPLHIHRTVIKIFMIMNLRSRVYSLHTWTCPPWLRLRRRLCENRARSLLLLKLRCHISLSATFLLRIPRIVFFIISPAKDWNTGRVIWTRDDVHLLSFLCYFCSCHVYERLETGFVLMIGFIELFDTARDYTLLLHTHTITRVYSHVFTRPCSVAASNGGRSLSSGFPNYPRPQLPASNSKSSQRLNLSSPLTHSVNSVTQVSSTI
jgi:hypothetical protein